MRKEEDGIFNQEKTYSIRCGSTWYVCETKYHMSFTVKLLSCIGETLEDPDECLCGVVVNIKPKFDRISLWTKEASNQDGNKKLG
jgi:hypothetical protein